MDIRDKKIKIEDLEKLGLKQKLLKALNDDKIEEIHEMLKVFVPIFESTILKEKDMNYNCKCDKPDPLYQEEEPDNNVHEFMFCGECGGELPLIEQNWDLEIKGNKYG
jgi:hypothetical protein